MDKLTPNRLLSTWDLEKYVEEYSLIDLKIYFDNAFKEIKILKIQKLSIPALLVRNNIQFMLDNLSDDNIIEQFKKLYKSKY